ncbi:hypothetical protein RI054_08g44610 [Pseudoscourfieldia marina]
MMPILCGSGPRAQIISASWRLDPSPGEAALENKPPYYDVFDEHFCKNKKVCADGVIDSGVGAKAAGVTSAGEAEAAAAQRKKKRLSASERQAALDEAKVAAFQQLGEGLRALGAASANGERIRLCSERARSRATSRPAGAHGAGARSLGVGDAPPAHPQDEARMGAPNGTEWGRG